MTDISEEFVEEQVEELELRNDVRAVGIVGSYAREPEGDHNDLDIFAVVEGDWRKRVTEKIDGVVVEKFFYSEEWIEKYLEEDGQWWKICRWLENVDVRYDPENVFEELKDRVEEFKHERLGEELDEEEFLYHVWDYQRDIESVEDVGQKRYLMNSFFDYLLENIYRLNDKVPVKENYRIENLKEFDGYLYKLSQEFLMSSSTMDKENKLDEIVENVTGAMGDPGPERETEREKIS